MLSIINEMEQVMAFCSDAFAQAKIKQWQKFTENKTCHTKRHLDLITNIICKMFNSEKKSAFIFIISFFLLF